MTNRITKETMTGKLSTELVDSFSECVSKKLSETKLQHKDILRFRLSVETAMCTWLETIGEGSECKLEFGKRFGRITVDLACEGKKCNPQQNSKEFGNIENSAMLQSLGLSSKFYYEDGINHFKLMPGSGFVIKLLPIFVSMIFGIGLAMILKTVAPTFSNSFNTQIVDPVFSKLMNILRAIASPLIFLAVLSGIYSIGDIVSLGSIGKKLMGRFVLMTFITIGVALVILLGSVQINMGQYSADGSSIKQILDLVLQFIPSDIISPFLNGNMLQIITISVVCGIVILVLGNNVSELIKIIDQIYSVVQLLMEAISHFVPLFVFISMFSFVLSDNGLELKFILNPVIGIVGSFVVMGLIVYPTILKVKYGVSFKSLIKKLIPTYIIAFTTASSAAAFSSNVETCEKSLGISNNLTRFGIPLGQVVYMPFAAAEYISISIVMAEIWNVNISVTWILIAVFIAGIMSIATPPIPGGSISIFTVLFMQLNIPEAALPIAIGIDLLLDYLITAGNIMCLQEEMIICADKTGLLDKRTLLSE